MNDVMQTDREIRRSRPSYYKEEANPKIHNFLRDPAEFSPRLSKRHKFSGKQFDNT